MQKALNDVPVLLIFFARPEPFSRTFAAVRAARPSKLFLYQDGPRAGRPDDVANIARCREIAESVDWECEIYRFYQEKNVGCDPSEYIAQKWAFEHVDRCIVIEDDDVASSSFFPYCAELLERYKNDERIAMICGLNHLGEHHANGCSYFFTNTGPIWGWATWKRVVDTWEPDYAALDDPYVVGLLRKNYESLELQHHLPTMFKRKADGRAFYETILGLSRFTQNRLCIVPAVNMIQNVGNIAEATHPTSTPSLWIYHLPLLETVFPLKHPRYVIDDSDYSRRTRFLFAGCPSWPRRCWRAFKRAVKRQIQKHYPGWRA